MYHSDTFSVTSSIYDYREENGRTYHRYKDGAYLLPNDEVLHFIPSGPANADLCVKIEQDRYKLSYPTHQRTPELMGRAD
jgi:hypothetical protein